MSDLKTKKKRKKKQQDRAQAETGRTGGSAETGKERSGESTARPDAPTPTAPDVKPLRPPGDLSPGELNNEIAKIDEALSNARIALPADGGLFTKLAHILKKILESASGKDNDGDDSGGEEEDTGENTRKNDTSGTGDGTIEEGPEIKKLIADYNAAAGELSAKIKKMPEVARILNTDPSSLDKETIDKAIASIEQDIARTRFLPPGDVGPFAKIAYILREILLEAQGKGGGGQPDAEYRKNLEKYKEAYSKIKDRLDEAPGPRTDQQADTAATNDQDEAETESGPDDAEGNDGVEQQEQKEEDDDTDKKE